MVCVGSLIGFVVVKSLPKSPAQGQLDALPGFRIRRRPGVEVLRRVAFHELGHFL